MRPLRYSINVTLDGCVDHRAGVPDEEMHRHHAGNIERADALLIGRVAVIAGVLCASVGLYGGGQATAALMVGGGPPAVIGGGFGVVLLTLATVGRNSRWD